MNCHAPSFSNTYIRAQIEGRRLTWPIDSTGAQGHHDVGQTLIRLYSGPFATFWTVPSMLQRYT